MPASGIQGQAARLDLFKNRKARPGKESNFGNPFITMYSALAKGNDMGHA